MTSPFEYGGTVEGPAFCNRKKELADLTAAAASGERLFVYSERRLGKTSLVQTVLRDLSKKHYASAYIDLWPTDGEASFITATARALTEAMSTTTGQFIEVAKQLFSRLTPSVTTDADGKPKVTFGLAAGARPGRELEEVLAAPAKIAESGKRKVVVVFDEVQQIAEYEDDMVERRLRSIIQKHRHVSYLCPRQQKASHPEDVSRPV
jgi:AAA+ ATPase superfamily predicted ATPase